MWTELPIVSLPRTEQPVSGFWTWDIRSDRVHGCANLIDYFGHTEQVAAGGLSISACTESIDASDRDRVSAAVSQAIKNHTPFRECYLVHTKSRGTRRILAQGRCYYDQSGEPASFPGWFLDVTRSSVDQPLDLMLAHQLARLARDTATGSNNEFICYLLDVALRELEDRLGVGAHPNSFIH